uniref:Uncharacterized protein n=1 Tax=viral metagenome TaxID=1070528 RepID=A0A6C0H5H9_9ZZZZ
MYSSNYSNWTPIVSDCPDYWTFNPDDKLCYNTHNLGINPPSPMDFNTSFYTGSDSLCNKYTWATQYKLQWDGITSGIPNPCDDTS